MVQFTSKELALAIKLTSVQGYSFSETAQIMNRNGSALISAEYVEAQITERAPNIIDEIEIATAARSKAKMIGITAAPPGRRILKKISVLVEYVNEQTKGQSEESICWKARLHGFDCNITDIRIAGKRCGYEFTPHKIKPIDYYDAIVADVCTWPINDVKACGAKREVGAYCGAHYCRSLGRLPA